MKVSHRITRLVLIALAVLALAAPAASAVPAARDTQPADRVVDRAAAPSCRASTTGSTGRRPRSAPALAGGIILLVGWGGITYRHRHEHIGVAH